MSAYNTGDVVRLLGGSTSTGLDYLESWGFEIGSLHTIIDSFPSMTRRDEREGWRGIKHNGTYYTVLHFVLEIVTSQNCTTTEGTKMHIEAMPRQYKVILDTQDISLIISALALAGAASNTLWKEDTKRKVLEMHTKLNNAKGGAEQQV